MTPPRIYVMSSGATGPRDDRRPAGILHAAPDTFPPIHTTYCGRSQGLFWFGHVDFLEAEGDRCPACVAVLDAEGRPGVRGDAGADT